MTAERRHDQRVAVRLRADLALDDEVHPVSFVTEDVSLGGARLRGRHVVPAGAAVLVALSAGERVVATEATVLDTRVLLDEEAVELRVQFTGLTDVRRERLGLLLAGD